jgi:hypothetical protein
MEHQLDATITVLLISKISSTCFGKTFVHLQERKTEIFITYGIMSCWCGRQGFWACYLALCVRYEGSCFTGFTASFMPSSNAQKPCLPHQQDIIQYVVKISVLRSWRWANVCPKHVELILEINKTVIVASSWCSIFTLTTSLVLPTKCHDRFLKVTTGASTWGNSEIRRVFLSCGHQIQTHVQSKQNS